mmetsp:Transcript_2180/g.6637  ORF Transcript_2180/g.6637 Transcript_2180/m.6637 type:complete len:206 (-) Transcript_2180:158-775(-)
MRRPRGSRAEWRGAASTAPSPSRRLRRSGAGTARTRGARPSALRRTSGRPGRRRGRPPPPAGKGQSGCAPRGRRTRACRSQRRAAPGRRRSSKARGRSRRCRLAPHRRLPASRGQRRCRSPPGLHRPAPPRAGPAPRAAPRPRAARREHLPWQWRRRALAALGRKRGPRSPSRRCPAQCTRPAQRLRGRVLRRGAPVATETATPG